MNYKLSKNKPYTPSIPAGSAMSLHQETYYPTRMWIASAGFIKAEMAVTAVET